MITHREFREKVKDVLSLHITCWQRNLPFLGKRNMNDIFLSFFFRKECLRFPFHLIAQQEKPVLVAVKTVDIRSIIADGIESTHDGTDTSSGNIIYRNISLFQHLEHTHFGSTLGATSTQNESHLLAGVLGLRRLLGLCGYMTQEAEQEQQT